MSATSYFVNKSNFVNNKYVKMMNSILIEYENSNIKSKTEYLYAVNYATKTFVESLNTPIFKFHKAKSTPISEHFSEMVNNAIDDLDILLNEAVYVGENINSINNEINSYITMFNNTTSQLNKQISFLEENVKYVESNRYYIFSDTFNDSSNMLQQSSVDLCRADYSSGYISLNTTIEREYANSLLIEIDEESNGFPGNTHEIEILGNEVSYVGESDPHIDIYNTTDGNDKTWFEYESFNISDDMYLNCNGYGFNYKEGISWITEDDKLKLTVKYFFDDLKLCNWFSISPYIDVNKSGKFPMIQKVVITDCSFNTQEIKIQKEFKDSMIVSFEPQDVKEIYVYLEQNYSYETDIGHYYSLKIDKNISIYENILKENYRRLDLFNPSVEALGVKYEPNTKKYLQPGYRNGERVAINDNIVKKELFTTPYSSDETIYSDIEILKSYRYGIGIKNVSISNVIFNEYSYYCSKKFTTNENIVSIELEADDYIPSSFKEGMTSAEYNPSNYLKYEISFDEGNVWYEIYPRHRVQYGPCCYNINSDVLPSMRHTKSIRYINRLLDTNSVMIRIVMNRRDGYIYDSPIVYSYKLNVITEEYDYENF